MSERLIKVPKKKYDQARMFKEIFQKETSRQAPLWWCLIESEKQQEQQQQRRGGGMFRI